MWCVCGVCVVRVCGVWCVRCVCAWCVVCVVCVCGVCGVRGVCLWCLWCVCVCVCGVCGVGVWVCGVCGSDDEERAVSGQGRASDAPNWVAEHLGASSRSPRHPFPAQMAGEPWPCTCVHGTKKPSRHTMKSNCGDLRSFCTSGPMTLMVMSPYRCTSHLSLRHLSLNLNREEL